MSGNNCDDAFQKIQQLQEDNQRLREQADEMERRMRAAGVYGAAAKGDEVILPGRNGVPKILDTADIKRGYKQLAGAMNSQEVNDIVARGFDELARPSGADGRFQNYDRILREVDISTAEDYARLAEALGITLERNAPDDFALITQTYGKERLLEIVSGYYRGLGASDADLLARAAVKTAPMVNAVENKVWLRFWADRSKRTYLDTLEEIRTYMNAIPGAPVPPELKQQAFKQYKLALVMERHNNLVTRRHAQALRSQQEALGLEQFRLDLGDEGEQAVADAIGLTGKDLDKDEHFGRVVQAIDDGGEQGTKQLELLIDATEADGLDPKARLDKDWFNTHMRMANAYIKDSQLGGLQTQIKMNAGSNAVMAIFGPLEQTFYNAARMKPIGTDLVGGELMEALKITAQATQFGFTALKTTWRRDLERVFNQGISHYSGNLDTYGKNLLTNEQEFADMQSILDMPYRSTSKVLGAPTEWLNPTNWAIFTNKLQAAARLLVLTKPGGMKEMNRIEAAWNALSLGTAPDGRQQVRVRDIDNLVPWKPYLRTMAGVDEVFGKFHYLFKLKADLEVKARMDGAQLGLLSERDRAEWVQARIDEAIYQATPSEENIKTFRKQNGLKGSDFTDDEIAAMLSERNLAGAPTLGSEESIDAMEHSARMRFQNDPQGGFAEGIDRTMMGARQDWFTDRYVFPYWRSMWNGVLLDHNLTSFHVVDTARMAFGKDVSPELVARTKAGWVMSGALFATYGMLDAAGAIKGSLEPDPQQRNRIKTPIGWLNLGGLPVFNTMFLWKDLFDASKAAQLSDFDQQEIMTSLGKVLTGHIVRQSGIQQVQLLMNALMDGSVSSWERVRKFVGFVGSGQVPFISNLRDVERFTGSDRSSYYRDKPGAPMENYLLNRDDPLVKAEQWLKDWAYDTLPITGRLPGGPPRIDTDHLGTPRGHIWGVDLSKAIPPPFPGVWPSGKINETVYPELKAQGLLDPPTPLLTRVLDGVAMSDDLQAEYNAIHGAMKGDQRMPPSARLSLGNKSVEARFPMPVDAVTTAGFRLRKDNTVAIPLGHKLDQIVAGRTKKEAFYQLFRSPWYQAIEDDPKTSANPAGGLPPTLRRARTAQVLIRAITDYYDLLTRDELERRGRAGTSPAAKAWTDAKSAMTLQEGANSLQEMPALIRRLNAAP